MKIRIRSALATAVHAYGVYAPATPKGVEVDLDRGTVAALDGDARVIVEAVPAAKPAGDSAPAPPAAKRPRKP